MEPLMEPSGRRRLPEARAITP